MHEATIATNILERIMRRIAAYDPPACARSVRVRIGEFRNVDLESLSFAFDSLKGLYPACAGCVFVPELIAATALCRKQQHKYHPDSAHAYRCSECGGGIGTLLAGEELDITDMELEVETGSEELTHARVS
jgi:hydrogenase nickel incorporation protein HypA/HybF